MKFKNIKLGKKITIGIGSALVSMLIVGGWSFFGINSIVNDAMELSEGNKLVGVLLQREVDHLNWAGELNKLLTDDRVTELTVQTDPHKCGFGKWYYGEGRKNAETFLPRLKEPLSAIEDPHRRLHESAVKIAGVYRVADHELPAILANKEADHLAWAGKVQGAILSKKQSVGVQLDHTLCAFGKMLFGPIGENMRKSDPEMGKLLDKIEEPHRLLHTSGKSIDAALSAKEFNKAFSIYQAETAGILETTREGIKKLQHRAQANLTGVKDAQVIYASETQVNLEQVQDLLNSMTKMTRDSVISEDLMLSKAVSTRLVVVIVVILALLIGSILGFVIVRGVLAQLGQDPQDIANIARSIAKGELNIEFKKGRIIGVYADMEKMSSSLKTAITSIQKTMNKVSQGDLTDCIDESGMIGELSLIKDAINSSIDMLSDTISQVVTATDQVNSGSTQISSASQSLASGTSEQAASLEEISSSMSEVGSRAKASNENANQAAQLTTQTMEIANRGNKQMKEMLSSMDKINSSSSDISKIIKVIDEIAFQTNLLALNAAVEAARAGKYGKGFAVVAEEVRNLAARSAEAAKNTTLLIENSVKEVDLGVNNAGRTAEILTEINASITKVNDLVGEIAAASQEQRNSTDEINKSLTQVNDVVQQNASISEEAASASEELSGQAVELQALMGRFKLSQTMKTQHPTHIQQTVSAKKVVKNSKMIILDDNTFGKY